MPRGKDNKNMPNKFLYSVFNAILTRYKCYSSPASLTYYSYNVTESVLLVEGNKREYNISEKQQSGRW
jgi:hypothetical protein